MVKGMGKVYGNQGIIIMIYIKESTLKITKMDMAYTNGQMELFTKGRF